jgi:cytoskeletal protein RodZ
VPAVRVCAPHANWQSLSNQVGSQIIYQRKDATTMNKQRTRHEDNLIRRRKRTFLTSAAMLVVFVGLCYLFVWERVCTLKLAEENSQTRIRVQGLKDKCQSLDFEINQLASLKRIEDIARRDLALVPAAEVQLAAFTASKNSATKPATEPAKIVPAEKTPPPNQSKKPLVMAKSASAKVVVEPAKTTAREKSTGLKQPKKSPVSAKPAAQKTVKAKSTDKLPKSAKPAANDKAPIALKKAPK